jgi:hypothetical protein
MTRARHPNLNPFSPNLNPFSPNLNPGLDLLSLRLDLFSLSLVQQGRIWRGLDPRNLHAP